MHTPSGAKGATRSNSTHNLEHRENEEPRAEATTRPRALGSRRFCSGGCHVSCWTRTTPVDVYGGTLLAKLTKDEHVQP